MNLHYFHRLFDYTFWMNRRVWECTLELNDEQFTRHSDYSKGSVHRQLVHTMEIEMLWLSRAKGVSPEAVPGAKQYPTRESIRARWDHIENEWRKYLATLADTDMDEVLEYLYLKDSGNVARRMRRWEVLTQVINHSTDHRAQILAVIHAVGGRTIEQDYTLFTWDHPDFAGV